tara:strand:+ start:194 stop:3646 length:3453 start_codon:yes stop_codon:yes gene_type:complete
MPTTMWNTWQRVHGAGSADTSTYDNEQVRLYGRLTAEIGDYRLGTRKEVNRNAIARLREQIRMQDNFTGQIHDLRESIAGDNQNLLDNVTKMRTTLTDARADLVKSRRPRSSHVYSAAMKRSAQGNAAVAKDLVEAYEDRTGSLSRVPDVQLYSILTEIDREMPGLLQVGPDGTMSVIDADISNIGDTEEVALKTMVNLANEAQRAYVSEQRAIDQSMIEFERRASDPNLANDKDQRAILATEMHKQLDSLMPRMMSAEGLISPEAAQQTLQDLQEEDAYYREAAATQEHLGQLIRGGGAGGDPLRAAMKKSMANENFLAWAEENGFDNLGAVQPDGSYVEGKQDLRAMMAFHRQTQKPNRYGRLGSPSATTGEFVTFEVKLSPNDALTMKTAKGYAYVEDETGRRAVSPAAATYLEETAQPGLVEITITEGKVGLYDPKTTEVHFGSQTRTLAQLQTVIDGYRADGKDPGADLDLAVATGRVVTTADGKPVTAADLKDGVLPADTTRVSREEWNAGRTQVTYHEDPPQTYWVSGEKMKRHGKHEINPELDGGYIEVLTPQGKRLFKADELVGPATVTAARSGTTIADVMWQRRGAMQRPLPGQEDPGAVPRRSRMIGGISIESTVDTPQLRTNWTDEARANGYKRWSDRNAYKGGVADREEKEAGEAAAARKAKAEQTEQLELSKELTDLEAAAASSSGGPVEELVRKVDDKTGAVTTSLEPVHLTQEEAKKRLADHGARLKAQESKDKAREERAADGIAADEAMARSAVEAAERGEDIEFEFDEDESEPYEATLERGEKRRAAAIAAGEEREKARKEAEEAAALSEKIFSHGGYTWKVQVDEDGQIVGDSVQMLASSRDSKVSEDNPKTLQFDDPKNPDLLATLQGQYTTSTAPAPAAPSPAEEPPTPEAPAAFGTGEEELAKAREEAKGQRQAKREGRKLARAMTKEEAAAAKAKKKEAKADARLAKDTALFKDKPKVAKRRAAIRKALSPRAAKALKGVTEVHKAQQMKLEQLRGDLTRIVRSPEATKEEVDAAQAALDAAEREHTAPFEWQPDGELGREHRAHEYEDELRSSMYQSGRGARQERRRHAKGAKAYLADTVAESDEGINHASVPGRLGLVAKMRDNRAQRQANRELAKQDSKSKDGD